MTENEPRRYSCGKSTQLQQVSDWYHNGNRQLHSMRPCFLLPRPLFGHFTLWALLQEASLVVSLTADGNLGIEAVLTATDLVYSPLAKGNGAVVVNMVQVAVSHPRKVPARVLEQFPGSTPTPLFVRDAGLRSFSNRRKVWTSNRV